MKRRLKFMPMVTRIKLNPEQAVLQCACYDGIMSGNAHTPSVMRRICEWNAGTKALMGLTSGCTFNSGAPTGMS